MTDKHESIAKKTYLKVTLILFCGWLFIAYVIFKNIRELGGFPGFLNEIKNGGYSDLFLLALGIFFWLSFFKTYICIFRSKMMLLNFKNITRPMHTEILLCFAPQNPGDRKYRVKS